MVAKLKINKREKLECQCPLTLRLSFEGYFGFAHLLFSQSLAPSELDERTTASPLRFWFGVGHVWLNFNQCQP